MRGFLWFNKPRINARRNCSGFDALRRSHASTPPPRTRGVERRRRRRRELRRLLPQSRAKRRHSRRLVRPCCRFGGLQGRGVVRRARRRAPRGRVHGRAYGTRPAGSRRDARRRGRAHGRHRRGRGPDGHPRLRFVRGQLGLDAGRRCDAMDSDHVVRGRKPALSKRGRVFSREHLPPRDRAHAPGVRRQVAHDAAHFHFGRRGPGRGAAGSVPGEGRGAGFVPEYVRERQPRGVLGGGRPGVLRSEHRRARGR